MYKDALIDLNEVNASKDFQWNQSL
jgi:hypothetical protein